MLVSAIYSLNQNVRYDVINWSIYENEHKILKNSCKRGFAHRILKFALKYQVLKPKQYFQIWNDGMFEKLYRPNDASTRLPLDGFRFYQWFLTCAQTPDALQLFA